MVPVFNSEATLPELVRRLDATLGSNYPDWEAILVNDGSADGSWGVIEALVEQNEHLVGIDLERNAGQHNALLAGIRAARMDVTVTLDDDLQNPPEEIPKLVEEVAAGWKVVYGKPVSKRHGRFQNWSGRLVGGLLGKLGGSSAPMVSSFRAFRTDLRRSFDSYDGPDVSIDSLLSWATESATTVPVEHHDRARGRSGYSLPGLVRHAVIMITAFSNAPLRIATTLGFLVTVFGVGVLAFVLLHVAIEGGSPPGFPFLASIISIFAGAQLFALGVLGEYLARMHVRVMGRPSYVERTRIDHREGVREAAAENAVGLSQPPRRLDWDSDFWGFGVARVEPEVIAASGRGELGLWLEENDIRCAFLLLDADDADTARDAGRLGFRYVDTRMTMGFPGGRQSEARTERGADVVVREAEPEEREAVMRMASGSFRQSRFRFDPKFPADRARMIHGEWVVRGFETPDRRVMVAEAAGGLAGQMVLHEPESGSRTVELIGVVDPARGSGVGSALLEEAKRGVEGDGRVEAVTQGRNIPALRMYERSGFRTEKSQVWYHLWV